MGNLMRAGMNRDKCQMAWAPVISRAWSDASDLRSVDNATSRKCQPPLIQTTEPCELGAQEHDQPDYQQVMDCITDHPEVLSLLVASGPVPKSASIVPCLWDWKIKQMMTRTHQEQSLVTSGDVLQQGFTPAPILGILFEAWQTLVREVQHEIDEINGRSTE
jgi:hypothetical protein